MTKNSNGLTTRYWLIMLIWLTLCALIGSMAAVRFGVNIYVGFIAGWCIPMFIEVFRLARKLD